MVVLSTSGGRLQAADLPDCDDSSLSDVAATDEIEPQTGTDPLALDPPNRGVSSDAPLPAGRAAVHDVFRPPTR